MPNPPRVIARHALVAAIVLALPVIAPALQGADAALQSGPSLDLRYRHESVDDAGFARDADADTLLLRLGYRWVFAPGWQLYGEGVHVQALFGEHYNSTANGKTQYPTVADPQSSAINQAYIGYSGGALTATLGRQRLQLDNQRFIGNSGWRQNEQTFDALNVRYAFSDGGPSLRYVYLDRVQRVNGHDNPDPLQRAWDLDGHLFNVNQALPLGALSGYGYLIENHAIATLSTQTWGLRWTGTRAGGVVMLGWTVEYARQSDWNNNPTRQRADYRFVESSLAWNGITLRAGREVLGGNGRYGFATPYATLHAFDGWADRFTTTPFDGLDDRYVSAGARLGKASWVVTAHDFHADRGGRHYGREFDASLAYPLSAHATGLVKVADYRSDGYALDTRKLWFSLEYAF